MTGWGRLGGALAAVGCLVALSACGQLFTEAQKPTTLTQLASRVDSLDTQVGELQATLAGGGTSTSGTEAAGSVQSGLPSAVVEADVLNVRDDPSLSGTVKGTLLQNAIVGILKEDGNWTEISYTNPTTQKTLTGWVDSDYLGPASPAAAGAASGATASAGSGAQASGTAASSQTASGAPSQPASASAAQSSTSDQSAQNALDGAY